MKFTLLTWNLLSEYVYPKRYPIAKRILPMIQLIQSHQPDFICLQEVTPTIKHSLIHAFAKEYHCIFFSLTKKESLGLLISKKHMIHTIEQKYLTSTPDQPSKLPFSPFYRGVILAQIDHFFIACTHIDPYHPLIQRKQIQYLKNICQTNQGIIAGDFNASSKWILSPLHDFHQPTSTLPSSLVGHLGTFFHQNHCIDHIFLSPKINVIKLKQQLQPKYSDHHPIIITFQVS